MSRADKIELSELALRAWSLKYSLDSRFETSHSFTLPALLQVEGPTLKARGETWREQVFMKDADLSAIQARIDAYCFDLYEVNEADRNLMTGGYSVSNEPVGERGEDDIEEPGPAVLDDAIGLTAELVSWAVGVAFGRFDVRLAIGDRVLPSTPGPFDSLPACSPAMLIDQDGSPVVTPPIGYPLSFPEDGILVDDPGHRLDMVGAVRDVFRLLFVNDADALWRETSELLDSKGGDMRTWLAKRLFEYHLGNYSSNRRKAPLYWQIGTRSANYSVWLYAHRMSPDTLFRVLNDIVVPKLQMEERELTRLRQDAGVTPAASQRKEIDNRERLIDTLRELCEELKMVIPLWTPNLDDGIVVVLAPLWRLFTYKPWSRELKKHWTKLANGDYDWTQAAMHLWPARVVRKCARDRSLAIAHGLEKVFWMQDSNNKDKWLPRQVSVSTIDDLIAKRHDPAVTSALQWVST